MTLALARIELVSLSGADARAFAHAQFTSNVNALGIQAWQWSAWLDPQGRVRAFFMLMRITNEEFLMWLPLGGAHCVRDQLARFVMRAAVKLDGVTDWTLHRLLPDPARPEIADRQLLPRAGGFAFMQPGPEVRVAWIAPVGEVATDAGSLARWRHEDVAARLPLLVEELAGEFVPQALDLEALDAIRFDKGCYPGQELAARLHFRGGNKRRLHRLLLDDVGVAPTTQILQRDGTSIGQILYAASTDGTNEAIAVLSGTYSSEDELFIANGVRAKVH